MKERVVFIEVIENYSGKTKVRRMLTDGTLEDVKKAYEKFYKHQYKVIRVFER